jgi:hypothetical protein
LGLGAAVVVVDGVAMSVVVVLLGVVVSAT